MSNVIWRWSLGLALLLSCPLLQAADARPNIVVILADDLGWADVGFQGQTKTLTPRLDALAEQSLRFESAYCPASVCGPTRAALLSGFHNGHTFVDRNGDLAGFRAEDVFFTQRLQAAGYTTGAFGKWGFGADRDDHLSAPESVPSAKGVDEFYGYLSHRAAHDYTPPQLWRTDELAAYGIAPEPYSGVYSHDDISAEAVNFIRNHAGDEEPFLLYVPFTIPHFDLDDIASLPGYFDAYADVPGADGWTDKAKKFAAMVTRMDASIGELIDALKDPDGNPATDDGIAENTLIIFSSDNGPTPEDNTPINFFDGNGIYRGGKRDLWDGGVRVPLIACWPGVIEPGVSPRLVDLTDIAPTLAELAETTMPPGHDGISLVPLLTGSGEQKPKPYAIFEHHEGDGPDSDSKDPRWAIRRGDDKLIKFADGTRWLYDLSVDPGETTPIDNVSLIDELTAIALAEQVEQGNAYTVEYRQWVGIDGDYFHTAANWNPIGVPAENWSASLVNNDATDASALLQSGVAVLGLEVDGVTHTQTLQLAPSAMLDARNELRIGARGRVLLDRADLVTNRWVDIRPGGELRGVGNITGTVYNEGVIEVSDGSTSTPPPAVDTGEITALTFDFTGVQNQAIQAASAQSEYVQLAAGLSYGAGVAEANAATNAGDEFNLNGFETSSLSQAMAQGDYLSFALQSMPGIEMALRSVTFQLWRNGANAATDYAITTSLDGHSSALATLSLNSGDTATHALTASWLATATTEPVEIRLVAWNAVNSGNTHFNACTTTANFATADEPPSADKVLAVEGDCFILPGGALRMVIDGHGVAGVDYPQLSVSGQLRAADCILAIELDAFTPALDQVFQLLLADTLDAEFRVSLPALPDHLAWDTTELNSHGRLEVIARPDFSSWINGFPFAPGENGLDDDPENDQVTNQFEYLTGGLPDVSDGPNWLTQWIVSADKRHLQIQFTRPENRSDLPLSGAVSDDLQQWSPAALSITNLGNGMESVVITDPVALEDAPNARFIQLRSE
ncbi:sulfatase-like hydrolase/transferase [Cerasicoccus fimbriatus]|uniref:sulfatase-like hydrolase/transferase n=1 Tax=Cerasicoccus fimbriatus TaxID=3014554 RepID=UPI0022B5B96E|nr:sulfatase-like hydrolase/transferase [Cerasicoccus sp. TK19100]